VLELAFAPTAAVALVAGLAVELRLFAPGRAPGRREAIVWSAGWLLLALAVAVGIALAGGPAGEWTTVYLIERSLSLDNMFLFSLLLAYFLVPRELRGRVILIGIAGALLLRGIVASLVADRLGPPRATEEATRRPPRCPRALRTPGPSERRPISNEAAPRT
jgi:hypothetical protein